MNQQQIKYKIAVAIVSRQNTKNGINEATDIIYELFKKHSGFPTLEEVRNYFRNAYKVECLFNSETVDITENIEKCIYYTEETNSYWIDIYTHKGVSVKLWNSLDGYAKIIKHKK